MKYFLVFTEKSNVFLFFSLFSVGKKITFSWSFFVNLAAHLVGIILCADYVYNVNLLNE